MYNVSVLVGTHPAGVYHSYLTLNTVRAYDQIELVIISSIEPITFLLSQLEREIIGFRQNIM